MIGHAHIPWENFNLTQLKLNEAAGIVIRPTWIAIVGSPYVGSLGVIGTLLAGIYFRRLAQFPRMLVLAFGAIALYGLLSGFGTNLGLAYLNFHVPLINRIREAGRYLVLFVIGVSFLSGFGYSLVPRIWEQYKQSRNLRLLIAPALMAIGMAGIILWEFAHMPHGQLPDRTLDAGNRATPVRARPLQWSVSRQTSIVLRITCVDPCNGHSRQRIFRDSVILRPAEQSA